MTVTVSAHLKKLNLVYYFCDFFICFIIERILMILRDIEYFLFRKFGSRCLILSSIYGTQYGPWIGDWSGCHGEQSERDRGQSQRWQDQRCHQHSINLYTFYLELFYRSSSYLLQNCKRTSVLVDITSHIVIYICICIYLYVYI